MDKITHEVRLNHWRQIIEQCQSRPKGQTTKQWLAENGISNKSYYYWQRKLRALVYDQTIAGNSLPAKTESSPAAEQAQPQPPVVFAELPFAAADGEPDGIRQETLFQPAVVVNAGSVSASFSNSVSKELAAVVIREVLRHA